MRRRIFPVLLAVLLLFGCISMEQRLKADDTVYTEGSLYYTVKDQSITVTGCFGRDAEVTVPSMIAGIPVNTIAKGAFTENRSVQKLYLPDTISKVERGAIGDWIKVIYNANTDHPQEEPTALILRNMDPEEGETAAPQPGDKEDTRSFGWVWALVSVALVAAAGAGAWLLVRPKTGKKKKK